MWEEIQCRSYCSQSSSRRCLSCSRWPLGNSCRRGMFYASSSRPSVPSSFRGPKGFGRRSDQDLGIHSLESVVKKFYLFMAGAAVLSALSLPAAAVMFRVTPVIDNRGGSIDTSSKSPPALSPEGKPVRVISLQGSASLAEPDAPGLRLVLPPPQPEMQAEQLVEKPPVAALKSSEVARSAPRQRVASAQRTKRSAAMPVKGTFAMSSLY